MSLNIDTKGFLNYSSIEVNHSFLSEQKTDASEAVRAAFSQALSQTQQANRVGTPSILSPDVSQVLVKPGDNMTSLVKNHLLSKGFVPNPSDLKKMVFDLARQNGIANPNLIFPGQRLQLASLEASLLEGSFVADNKKPSTPVAKDLNASFSDASRHASLSSSAQPSSELGLSDGEQVLEPLESHGVSAQGVKEPARGGDTPTGAVTHAAIGPTLDEPSQAQKTASAHISTQQLLEQRAAISKMAAGVTTSSHAVAPFCLSGPWRSPGRAWAGSTGAATVVTRPSRRFRNGWRGGSAEPSRHPSRTVLRRRWCHRRSVGPDGGL